MFDFTRPFDYTARLTPASYNVPTFNVKMLSVRNDRSRPWTLPAADGVGFMLKIAALFRCVPLTKTLRLNVEKTLR